MVVSSLPDTEGRSPPKPIWTPPGHDWRWREATAEEKANRMSALGMVRERLAGDQARFGRKCASVARGHLDLARLHLAGGSTTAAQEAALTALEICRSARLRAVLPDAGYLLGGVLAGSGRLREGREEMVRAVELHRDGREPDDAPCPAALVGLAEVCEALGETDVAREHLEIALRQFAAALQGRPDQIGWASFALARIRLARDPADPTVRTLIDEARQHFGRCTAATVRRRALAELEAWWRAVS